jgi:hypothetical protein
MSAPNIGKAGAELDQSSVGFIVLGYDNLMFPFLSLIGGLLTAAVLAALEKCLRPLSTRRPQWNRKFGTLFRQSDRRMRGTRRRIASLDSGLFSPVKPYQ